MKTFRKELWLETKTRRDFVHLTPQVQDAVRQSGVKEGLCLVNAMHITASVFINDNESGLHQTTNAGWIILPHKSQLANICLTVPGKVMPMLT